ncbi:hypothetical protein [Paraburkholderia kururiensis]|uniref:hypothetical protein n=1 Tax=Paraburkholderia kururiensis TaxID=984307 RepID=UPI0018F41323|nr:hypothetical protein [Paraburkholderia kururiensis]
MDTERYLKFGPSERLNAVNCVFVFQFPATGYLVEPRNLPSSAVVALLDIVGSDGGDREFARQEVTWGEIGFNGFGTFALRSGTALPVSAVECRIYATGGCEVETPPVLRVDAGECITPASTSLVAAD